MSITLYSNDCPKCKILKKFLDSKNIKYNEFTDIESMIKMGMCEMPILEVENSKLNFHEALQWVKGVK